MRDIEIEANELGATATDVFDVADGSPIPRIQRLELAVGLGDRHWEAKLHFADGSVETCRARLRYVRGRHGDMLDLRTKGAWPLGPA